MSIEAFLCTGNVVDFFIRRPPISSTKVFNLERSPSPNNSPTTSFFTRIVEKIAPIMTSARSIAATPIENSMTPESSPAPSLSSSTKIQEKIAPIINPVRSFTPGFNPAPKISSTDILKIEEKIPSTIRKSIEPKEKRKGKKKLPAEDTILTEEEKIQRDRQRWETLNILLDNEGKLEITKSDQTKYRNELTKINELRKWPTRQEFIEKRIPTDDLTKEELKKYQLFFSWNRDNDYEKHLIVANVAFYHILANYNATKMSLTKKDLNNDIEDVKQFMDLIFESCTNQHRIDQSRFNLDISRFEIENFIYEGINWFYLADYFLVYMWNEANVSGIAEANEVFKCMMVVLNIKKKDAHELSKDEIKKIRRKQAYKDLTNPLVVQEIPNLLNEYPELLE